VRRRCAPVYLTEPYDVTSPTKSRKYPSKRSAGKLPLWVKPRLETIHDALALESEGALVVQLAFADSEDVQLRLLLVLTIVAVVTLEDTALRSDVMSGFGSGRGHGNTGRRGRGPGGPEGDRGGLGGDGEEANIDPAKAGWQLSSPPAG